jgi:hypothetical protein
MASAPIPNTTKAGSMTERQIAQESGYSRGVVHRKLAQGRTAREIIEAGKERQKRQTDTIARTEAAKGSSRKRESQDPTRGESYASAQARKESALADLREMEAARERGELLPRDEVAQAWGEMISSARSTLLQLGAKLAPRITAGMSLAEREFAIDAEVRTCLTALSTYSPKE